MSEEKKFLIKKEWQERSLITKEKYESLYLESLKNNEIFWKKEGKRIDWIKPYSKIKDVRFSNKDVHIKWFYDGTLNASYNCIDRHALSDPDRIAIIWESDNPNISKK